MSRRSGGRKRHSASEKPKPGPAGQKSDGVRLPRLQGLARRWTTFVGTVVAGLVTWVVSMLAGMQPVPGTVPLFTLVHDRPLPVLLVGGILLVLTAAAWVIAHQPDSRVAKPAHRSLQHHIGAVRLSLLAMTTGAATLSTFACVAVVAVVLQQPDWCPTALCHQPTGPNDKHLEADFVAFQSPTYVIHGDPSHFSAKDSPSAARRTSVAAQRTITDDRDLDSPAAYRVALKVHSLEPGDGMVIQRIELAVVDARQPTSPLRVILLGVSEEYRANPYRVVFEGGGNERLVAQYMGTVRVGHVQLKPGETDALVVQVASRRPVDLRFQLLITYRITTEKALRTLPLPYVFEAVFSDQLNWQQFQLRGDHLVPG